MSNGKPTAKKKSRLRVNADRIQFLDRLKRPAEPSQSSEAGQQQGAPAAASEPSEPSASALSGKEKGDDDNLPF